jgi:branched-chain amino acid aminotransferase
MFGTDEKLGIHTPHHCIFSIITCPVGSYFPEGINPVKILIEKNDVRAVKGGTGYVKCGGNYAASLRAGEKASEQGYAQVLWLDGVERKYIEEAGGMNVMFKIDGKVVTPALMGSVLSGITRKSIIQILESWNIPVEERLLSLDELLDSIRTGKLEEAWCCGTAAVISPIGELAFDNIKYTINDFKTGTLTKKLYDELTGIQWGKRPDPFGWNVPVI